MSYYSITLNSGDMSMIPVRRAGTQTDSGDSDSKQTSAEKSRTYKQCFRSDWQYMPEFREWLVPLKGDRFAAYCKLCKKKLSAHRLSLQKHSASLKHHRLTLNRQVVTSVLKADTPTDTQTPEENTEKKATLEILDFAMHGDEEDELQGDEADDSSDPEEPSTESSDVGITTQMGVISERTPISTHVIDTARGLPATGLSVILYKLQDSRWTFLNEGVTDMQGRISDFVKHENFSAGRYKLHFGVDRYFELRRQHSFYPFIEVAFDVKQPSEFHHVPLLLSPYGYSTYRGN